MNLKVASCLIAIFLLVESKPVLVQLDLSNLNVSYDASVENHNSVKSIHNPSFFANIGRRHGLVSNIVDFFGKVSKDATQSGFKSAGYCLSCKVGVGMIKDYMYIGGTENGLGKLAKDICNLFRIETARVCSGLSGLFKREMFMVLKKAEFTPSEICGMIFGPSCSSGPTLNWTVPLPSVPKPPVKPILPPKPGSPVTRVLHLSDVHLDPYYMEGSLGNCNEPLCCRKYSGVPTKPSDAAGYWGDYRNCDTPLRTLESVLNHINKTQKFDYVIWTGDIPPHDIWDNSRMEVLQLINSVTNMVDDYLGAVPIFPALGNHESSPVDSFPIPEVSGNDSISWLYNPLYQMWNKWVTSKNAETMKLGAYYTVMVNPGLKLISLNMNYCNNLNWWLLINSTDPANELNWLVQQLQSSEDKGEKVHIIGHIPPGNSDCLQVWSRNYYEIIKRYESTIAAQFFGHTHSDEFAVFYDNDDPKQENRPFGLMYIGPSVTTFMGYNPGYRIYTIDGNYPSSSRVVLDHENYIMNLTEANIHGSNAEPNWFLEYVASKAYNMPSLLPSNWDYLIRGMKSNDDLFQQYYRYYVKYSDHFPDPCNETCKKERICSLQRGRYGPIC